MLAPHESTVINVRMDSRRFRGKRTATIHVRFGPDDSSTNVVLQVSANARPHVICNPQSIEFNTVACGRTVNKTLDMDYAGELAWKINKVTAPAAAPIAASLEEAFRRPGEVGYRLTVTLKASAAPGSFREQVLLETNDPDAPCLAVPVEATVEAPLMATPANIDVGNIKVGQVVTRKVLVRGNQPFRILGIEASEGVKVDAEPSTKAKPLQTMSFQLLPSQPGAIRHEIEIKTDLQDAPMTVLVEGIVVP